MNTKPLPITDPGQCILAIAVPTAIEDFMADLSEDSPRDFCKRISASEKNKYAFWREYYLAQIVNPVQSIAEELAQYNLNIYKNFTFSDLKKVTKGDVFTIVAHWVDEEEKIEFFDGLYTMEEFEANIPTSFRGIIDLTICNSIVLFEYIKKKRGANNLVIANQHSTSGAFRLPFYKATIKLLANQPQNYIDAITTLRLMLNKT